MAGIDNETVNLLEFADMLSESNPRFSSRIKKCRRDLVEFLRVNDYFGLHPVVIPGFSDTNYKEMLSINRADAEKMRPNLDLWLRSYGSDSNEKLKLLTERVTALYPETGGLFSGYIEYIQADKSAAWKLADYLCFALDGEITKMSHEKLDSLASDMDKDLPLNSARLFSGFLMYARERGRLSNGWVYNFNSRRESEADPAYTAPDFLRMAYIVFNEEAWDEEHALEKALQSERDANLWLFVSLHFICGWRGTDLVRIPMPALLCGGARIRAQIADGCFDAGGIINELEYRLRYTPLIPQKTEMHENVPELKLFVPESLRGPFGIILAVAASHHESTAPGRTFIRKAGDRPHILSFFGEDFLNACGGRGFSSRRANKAYLQGIEMMADASGSQPKGYMLAALARSHKGGYGSLPETTDIYLRDAKFSGYRPEFIAREMFERGVFSFIPALMMEMYAVESYTNLPVPVQTKVLAEIGIDPSGLEGISKTVEASLVKARHAIAEVMRRPEDVRGGIADILQNIAAGNAPGKQDGFLCLMTASGSVCVDANRSSCIGCGYEIYTKTILHYLSKEYARLLAAKNTAVPAEAARCVKILKEAVMPAIAEMVMCIKRMYPDADMKAMITATGMGALLC